MSQNPSIGLVKPEETSLAAEELAAVEKLQRGYHNMRAELGKVIVGQEAVIEELLIALFCRGHAMLEGVPGLAKTLLISTLSRTLGLSFNRIQFTPDLMPSDITGTEVIEEDKTTGGRVLRFVRGPVFANVILADEINRTPPKTQAALLEAMQEHQVTAGGKMHRLPQPFFVLATQNPIEQEGTYPLPEAQLDRFMMQLIVDYPTRDEEERIVTTTTGDFAVEIRPMLNADQLLDLQHLVRRLPAPPSVVSYAVRLARSTRPNADEATTLVKKYVSWGAGPRASQYLILGAKARAAMDGRAVPDLEDVNAMAVPVLSHRVVVNFQAEAEGMSAERLVSVPARP